MTQRSPNTREIYRSGGRGKGLTTYDLLHLTTSSIRKNNWPKSKEKSLLPSPSYYDQLHPKKPAEFWRIDADCYPVGDEYKGLNVELIVDSPLFRKKNKHLKDGAKGQIRAADVLKNHVVQQEKHLGNDTQDQSAGSDTFSCHWATRETTKAKMDKNLHRRPRNLVQSCQETEESFEDCTDFKELETPLMQKETEEEVI
ncbi:hypothetical protein RUND412_002630 [Rhizina undulata]